MDYPPSSRQNCSPRAATSRSKPCTCSSATSSSASTSAYAAPATVRFVVTLPAPDQVLLVREYAVGVEGHVLGLPKGGAEIGESYLQAAQRELSEDTACAPRA